MKRQQYWIAEAGLVVLALLCLWLMAGQLRDPRFMETTGDRYLIDYSVPVVMPDSVKHQPLAAACGQDGADSQASKWRESLCQGISGNPELDSQATLTEQLKQAQSAFAAPLRLDDEVDWVAARAGQLPQQQADSQAQWSAWFSRRYDLQSNAQGSWHSPALQCAIEGLLSSEHGWTQTDARLMAAAVLAGRNSKVRQGLRQLPPLPAKFSASHLSACQALGSPAALLLQASKTMSQANISLENARKASIMQSLPQRAGWILLLYASLTLLLLNFSRAPGLPLGLFTGIGLMLWAAAGHFSQLLLPATWPSGFWWGLMGVGLAICLISSKMRRGPRRPAQYVTSRLGLAVFVLLTGIGWLVLLDLSTHAHEKNRYLALYQQNNLLVAYLLLSLLPAWRLHIMQGLSRLYAALILSVDRWQWLRMAGALVCVVIIALLLRNQRQFTSELWRLWLLFGLGYFLCMRGTLILQSLKDNWRPLALILAVPLLGFVVTDDNGPLLVTLFGGILLLGGLTTAFLRSEWRWKWQRAVPAGLLLSGGLSVLLTLFLFTLGQLHERTRERLASVFDPYSAVNDQMALVHNFRASIPDGGYHFGDVPWCGEMGSRFCAGVPAQIQSDYTLTALQGVLGTSVWIFLLLGLMLLWWMRLLFNQRHAVRSLPELGGMTASNAQSWISWMCLSWIVLLLFQMFITVAANMGFFPLTGITLPFISYGSTALWANSILLALSLNVLLPKTTDTEQTNEPA